MKSTCARWTFFRGQHAAIRHHKIGPHAANLSEFHTLRHQPLGDSGSPSMVTAQVEEPPEDVLLPPREFPPHPMLC